MFVNQGFLWLLSVIFPAAKFALDEEKECALILDEMSIRKETLWGPPKTHL